MSPPQTGAPRPFGVFDGLAALVVVLIWAFNFIVAKVGVSEVPPMLMMALRFALVTVLLAPFLKPPAGRWRSIFGLSVVLGLFHFGLLFVGLARVGAGPAAVAIQLTAPFSALLAAIFYGERLGGWQLLGMAIAFAGVWLLAGEPTHSPNFLYLLLVIAAAFAWSLANVLIKRLGPINPFVLNGWLSLFAFPQLLLASAVFERGQLTALVTASWLAWAAIVYMAVAASIVAYGLWYRLVEQHEMNRVVPMTLLAPVLAVGLACVLLGEPLSPRTLVGGLAVLVGVAMIQFLRSTRRRCEAT